MCPLLPIPDIPIPCPTPAVRKGEYGDSRSGLRKVPEQPGGFRSFHYLLPLESRIGPSQYRGSDGGMSE